MSTTRTFLILALTLLFTSCSQAPSMVSEEPHTPKQIQEGFGKYESEALNIAMQYPEDWKLQENGEAMVKFIAPEPATSETTKLISNVNIVVEALDDPEMTLEQYTEEKKQGVYLFVANSAFVEEQSIEIGELPGYLLVFTGGQEEYPLRWLQVWTVQDGKAYIFTYTAADKNYSTHEETVTTMLESLELR